jgi:hypothetical protein
MNLLPLAPDIQEEILALEVPAGRQPLSERAVRRLTESLLWTDQREPFGAERPGIVSGQNPPKPTDAY